MTELSENLRKDPVVNAAATVADYLDQFQIALGLGGLCEGNPNIGKPEAGRFDFKNIIVEEALRDARFTGAMGVLIANRSNPDIQKILDRLYQTAPQVQEIYQQ